MHRNVGDFILDIADNSFEAGAHRIEVGLRITEDEVTVRISDDGRGMSDELLQRVRDPYYTDGSKHPGRTVGLGIPFLIQSTEQCGGSFDIESKPGVGTSVSFSFPAENIDSPPLGELDGALAMLMVRPAGCEVIVERSNGAGSDERGYRIARSELENALGELESVESQRLVRQFLASHEEDIE